MKKYRIAVALILLISLVLPVTAFASELHDDRVVFGEDVVLEMNEIQAGDLVVIGGSATLEQGSLLKGDLFVAGGDIDIAGEVVGDIVALGGDINLAETAEVSGDVVAVGGDTDREAGAAVGGEIVSGEQIGFPFEVILPLVLEGGLKFGDFAFDSGEFGELEGLEGLAELEELRELEELERPGGFEEERFDRHDGFDRGPFGFLGGFSVFSPILAAFWFIFRMLLIAALAVLVVLFWPEQTARVGGAVVVQPIATGALGFLTMIVAPFVLFLMAITIILSPVSLIAFIILALAAVYGWIGLGYQVGQKMVDSFEWNLHPATAAGLGTLLLTLVIGGLSFVPCLGFVLLLLTISMGLGSVLLTRFGSREFKPGSPEVPAGA